MLKLSAKSSHSQHKLPAQRNSISPLIFTALKSHPSRPSRRPRRSLQTIPRHNSAIRSKQPAKLVQQSQHPAIISTFSIYPSPSLPSINLLPPPPTISHSLLTSKRQNHNFNNHSMEMSQQQISPLQKFSSTTFEHSPSPQNHDLYDESKFQNLNQVSRHSNTTTTTLSPSSSTSPHILPLPSSIPLTHLKFSHRPRVITLDVTGTLLTTKSTIADLYKESAAKVGISVNDTELLQKSFLQAYRETSEQYPNFGGNGQDLPNCRTWWYLVVKLTFLYSGYNLPYHQQDILFEQIYSDFGMSDTYKVYTDVIPFLNFISKYNKFVQNPQNRQKLYKEQRKKLRMCLSSPINEKGVANGNTSGSENAAPSSQEELEEICQSTHGYLHYNPILIGVVSNADGRYQDSILPLLGLHKHINFYVISERESTAKPNRMMFDRAVTKANQLSNYLGHNVDNKQTVACTENGHILSNPAPNCSNDNDDTLVDVSNCETDLGTEEEDSIMAPTSSSSSIGSPIDTISPSLPPSLLNSTSISDSTQSNNQPSTSSTDGKFKSTWGSIPPEDILHIGDNLTKDVLGAFQADFDNVYLLRDPQNESLLNKYLAYQEKQKQLPNNNFGNTTEQVITGDNQSHTLPTEFIPLLSLVSLLDDYDTMQNITATRLVEAQQNTNNAIVQQLSQINNNNITTFRNLLQVRDAYFYDVVDIIDRL